ncbi:MAG: hypothetical protein E6699_38205, partial [Bradyrhizobium sp.]|uniref:hypothetical protein n=1 Tax=Bradyrhizobium sp. TaxID=376 RepID=UPI00290400F8
GSLRQPTDRCGKPAVRAGQPIARLDAAMARGAAGSTGARRASLVGLVTPGQTCSTAGIY